MVGAITSTGSLYVGIRTAARSPGRTSATGSGPRESMFHSVTMRISRPTSGTASNTTRVHAATRSQPSVGIVNATRQVT